MRIGVIGLGTVGATHLEALRELGVDEILGADVSSAARERARPSTARCVADYRDLLATAGLDGVVIATPPRTHRAIALAALEAGVGVLCEKPLALTLADCDAIADLVSSARGPFQIGFCHRFQPQMEALHGLIHSGSIGDPVLVSIGFAHGLTEEGRQWITDPQQAGGGVLFDSGSHAIDLFRYLIGEIDEVHGLTGVLASGPVEDASVACMSSGNVLGSISLSWKTPPWQGLVEVIGTNGRARVEYEERVHLRVRTGDAPWRALRTPSMSRFVSQMRHFLACVLGDETPRAGVRDGLEATRAVLRIYDERRTSGTRGPLSNSGGRRSRD
jgi:predicted dehydrogenase